MVNNESCSRWHQYLILKYVIHKNKRQILRSVLGRQSEGNGDWMVSEEKGWGLISGSQDDRGKLVGDLHPPFYLLTIKNITKTMIQIIARQEISLDFRGK